MADELYSKEFEGKSWDEMTEEERAKRAEEAFTWKPQHLWLLDPETGKYINGLDYLAKYPRTEIDDIEEWDEDDTADKVAKRLFGE